MGLFTQLFRKCLPAGGMTARPPLMACLALMIGLACFTGCAPTHNDVDAFMRHPRPLVTSTDYIIAPPDILAFSSRNVAEVSDREAIVRPDGTITVPLLGTIPVAGRTPEQVSATLTEMATEYYERPNVTVSVVSFQSKKIFIFGEVTFPGSHQYDGANTVLEMLAEAQPTRLADFEKVQIIRPSPEPGQARRMTVSLKNILRHGDTSRDAVLEEGDILYIPPNPLAAVGLAFQQLLLPLQPAAATVNTPLHLQSGFQRANSGSLR